MPDTTLIHDDSRKPVSRVYGLFPATFLHYPVIARPETSDIQYAFANGKQRLLAYTTLLLIQPASSGRPFTFQQERTCPA